MEHKHYFDRDRHFYLAKVVDGEGNIYIFNVPPTTNPTVKAVLREGELISFKEGTKPFRRIDSKTDGFSRKYQYVEPVIFQGSGTAEELRLLSQARRNAPVPGKETTRTPPPRAPSPTKEVEAEPAVEPQIAEAAASEAETFEGRIVHRDDKGRPFVPHTKICVKCMKDIPGRFKISEVDGKFTKTQGFSPYDRKGGPIKFGSRDWQCGCMGEDKQPKPAVAYVPAPDGEAFDPAQAELVRGMATYKFYRIGSDYWYTGHKIVKDGHGSAIFRSAPCSKCQTPIKFRAGVTIRDGKPWNVSTNRPVGQKAKPVEKRSTFWTCENCLTGKTTVAEPAALEPAALEPSVEPAPIEPAPIEPISVEPVTVVPTPVEPVTLAPTPEEITLMEVVAAAQAAGAVVRFSLGELGERQQEPPPPLDANLRLIAELEKMAKDDAMDDKMFRGAAWMMARFLGGKLS